MSTATDLRAAELPGGYVDAAGRLHRRVRLRSLTGREEEALASVPAATPEPNRAELVTAVLSRCVVRLGEFEPVPAAVLRELLVADRDYLLLQLRRLTFGDTVRADLICPWTECGERISIEFSLADLPVREAIGRAPLYRLVLAGEGPDDVEVWFRLPDGSDQEQLSGRAADAELLTELLLRCIRRIGDDAPSRDRIRDLPAGARAALEAEMERLAPALERTLETRCAECGRTFVAPFDLHRFFFGELRTDRDLLYREVHYLAYHYHWSENDIMAMPRSRRRTYLEVLGEQIERLNDAV